MVYGKIRYFYGNACCDGLPCASSSSQKGMTNKEVKLKLRSSCLDLGLSHNRQGWGHIWLPGLLT